MHPRLIALPVVLTILAASTVVAQANGGYAGLDGNAAPVPTPKNGMFSPHPRASGMVAPPATTYAPATSYSRYRGSRAYPQGSMASPHR